MVCETTLQQTRARTLLGWQVVIKRLNYASRYERRSTSEEPKERRSRRSQARRGGGGGRRRGREGRAGNLYVFLCLCDPSQEALAYITLGKWKQMWDDQKNEFVLHAAAMRHWNAQIHALSLASLDQALTRFFFFLSLFDFPKRSLWPAVLFLFRHNSHRAGRWLRRAAPTSHLELHNWTRSSFECNYHDVTVTEGNIMGRGGLNRPFCPPKQWLSVIDLYRLSFHICSLKGRHAAAFGAACGWWHL